jgi:hypothetical protein
MACLLHDNKAGGCKHMKQWTTQRLEKQTYKIIMERAHVRESFGDCLKRLFDQGGVSPRNTLRNRDETGYETLMKHLDTRLERFEAKMTHFETLLKHPRNTPRNRDETLFENLQETPVELDMDMIE